MNNDSSIQNQTSTTRPKAGWPWLTVFSLMLICAILGSIGGGIFVHKFTPNNFVVQTTSPKVTSTQEPEEDIKNTNDTTYDQGNETKANSPAATDKEEITPTPAVEPTVKPEDKLLTPREIANLAGPSVVSINTQAKVQNVFGRIGLAEGAGSGVLISEDGVIVTNNHVIARATSISVSLANGEKYDAKVIGQDFDSDIAVIKIEGEKFPYLEIGDSDTMQMGDQVVAIGNPLGELEGSLTVGYISATDRTLTIQEEDGNILTMYGLLQTDAAINRGNSGGALINMKGKLIGINSAKNGSVGVEGLGFAIPTNRIVPVVEDLLKYGKVKNRPTIGITGTEIRPDIAKQFDYPLGIYVRSVEDKGSAQKAGILKGDIITKMNDKSIRTISDINAIKSQMKLGDTLKVEIYRGGKTIVLDLILATEETAN